MGLVSSIILEILEKPTIWDVMAELTVFMVPLWVALVVGVLVGWTWRPKWVNLRRVPVPANESSSQATTATTSSESSEEKESQSLIDFSLIPSLNSLKLPLPSCISWISDDGLPHDSSLPEECSPQLDGEKSSLLSGDDFDHLWQLVEEKDGGPAWMEMMDRSTETMHYQAWRREPEIGPPQYRSRTIYEDATPEQLRDFFWDDAFRAHWDDMLIHSSTLEECPTTGVMIVRWVRKFPFFCSDREYISGRRIWESGRSYYCVTKAVPCPSVPRHSKPRRVDLYYSSWFIRAVESKKTGKLTACEVLLFHLEDMGIPREIAKLGIRQGMWGAVKKIEPGLRSYQKHRASNPELSPSARMAQINTRVSAHHLQSLQTSDTDFIENENMDDSCCEKKHVRNIPKLLFVGGAVVLACSLDRGLLTKAVIFGVARKFAKIGRRL